MQITRVTYGYTTLPKNWIVAGADNEPVPIDFSFFLLRDGKRTVLVDAGCDTVSGFVMTDFIGPVEALRRLGVAAEEVTDILITHSHGDHMAGVRNFPKAHVYVHRLEYEKGKKYLCEGQPVTLVDDRLAPFEGVTMVHIGGHSPGSCVVEVGSTVLCGDECYTRYNLIHKVPTASSCNKAKSQEFIDRYATGWETLLCHQP